MNIYKGLHSLTNSTQPAGYLFLQTMIVTSVMFGDTGDGGDGDTERAGNCGGSDSDRSGSCGGGNN